MKLAGRILIILLAALVVVTAAIGLSQTSYADTLTPTMQAGAPSAAPSVSSVSAATGETGTAVPTSERPMPPTGEARHGGEHAGGLFGAVDIAKNLGIIGLIVGLVALAPLGTRRLRRRSTGRRVTPAPPSDQ